MKNLGIVVVFLTFAVVAGAAAFAVLSHGASAVAGTRSESFVVDVGDVIRLDDSSVGCVVVRKRGERLIDCRRAGPLRGSYGTLIGQANVRVVRFRNDKVARTVFTAKHGGSFRKCA